MKEDKTLGIDKTIFELILEESWNKQQEFKIYTSKEGMKLFDEAIKKCLNKIKKSNK